MTTNEELIAEASRLIADCMTYNFGMHNADKLAHEIAPKLVAALAALTTPAGRAFFTAASEERKTHAERGWTMEHDRKHGPQHPLKLAIDYLANGKPVKAGSLIMAALDLLKEAALTTPQEVSPMEALRREAFPALYEPTLQEGDAILQVTLVVQDALDCTIEDYYDYKGGGVGCTEHEVDVEEMGDHLVCAIAAGFAEKLLAAFPVLSRDIAGEIEAEIAVGPHNNFNAGLRRAAETVRNGR